MNRIALLGAALATVALGLAAPGCRSTATRVHPADAIIEAETDPEARQELEAIRAATDEEMRKKLAELDAEIERLEAENEELRKKVAR
jgi:Skp family chaperone for outer membrane proteins